MKKREIITGVVVLVLLGGGIAIVGWGPESIASHGEALVGLGLGLLTKHGVFGSGDKEEK